MQADTITIQDQFKDFEQSLNGSAKTPFHQKRLEAFKAFERVGFPHQKHEEYRYLNLNEVKNSPFVLPTQQQSETVNASDYFVPKLKANTLVFIDGFYDAEQSSIIDKEGITIQTIDETPNSELENHFGEYHFEEKNPFAALNIAFAKQGFYIRIAKGKVVELPIQIVNINTGQNWVQPHHLLIAEENSQVRVIENYFSTTDIGIDNTFLRIIAHKNAIVDHYKLQALGENANHFGTTHIQQDAKSNCTTHVYNLSGGLIRNNIRIDIEEEHTEANMYGLYVPSGNEVVDNHTVVNHKVSHCESNQLYKGVMNGNSNAIFNGKIYVQRDAQQTNAFQSNRNILNSDNATVNTKPQLEIWADDVKCSHGATIGQLNEDEIFYLQARGINKDKAESMLTYAFAGEVLTYIKIPELRNFLQDGVAAKLGFEL